MGILIAIAIVLYPANVSRPRLKTLGSGVPARIEALKRPKAGISKKNGSSVSPAKKITPLCESVVSTGVGATSAVLLELVEGAVNDLPFGRLIVAVCACGDPPTAIRGENRTSMAPSGLASPEVSSSNL